MKGGPQELVRLNELAVDALLGTLADEDVAEYQALRARHPDFDDSELERAAAVMHLAGGVAAERLPETLRAKLAGDATYFFGAGRRDRRLPTPPHQRHASWKLYGGWMAAAACLIGALIIWVARPSREVTVHAATGAPTASGGAPVAPGTRAVSLTPTVSAALTETSDASAVAGTPGQEPIRPPTGHAFSRAVASCCVVPGARAMTRRDYWSPAMSSGTRLRKQAICASLDCDATNRTPSNTSSGYSMRAATSVIPSTGASSTYPAPRPVRSFRSKPSSA